MPERLKREGRTMVAKIGAKRMPGLRFRGWLALAVTLIATPVFAQSANFGSMTLKSGFSNAEATATGYTNGSFSLASIANRDRNNNLCLGYAGDRDVPDHLVVLQNNFAKLTFQVNSKGNSKPTLLVLGPDKTVRCGDARIEDKDWGPGTYSVWVGSSESGRKYNYTFLVRE